MQLITIILYVVAILTILSGISVLFGSKKQTQLNAVWFFIATVGSAIWSSSIATFLSLSPSDNEVAPWLVIGIFVGITVVDVAMVGYTGWQYKIGKILTPLYFLAGIAIVGLLIRDPSIFYSSISLNNTCNQLNIVKDWYYVVLIVYYTIMSVTFSMLLSYKIKHTANKKVKAGQQIFSVGLSIGGILALIFDLILLTTLPNLVWIGPVAVSVTILTFYYSVVKYRILQLSSTGMKIMSYVILMTTGIIIYMVVFYAIFTALFKIPNPSGAILILNLLTVAVALCLVPAAMEISAFMRSLISTRQVNIGYVTKNLRKLEKQSVNLRELAEFLADHLHSSYVGLVINDKIYGSSSITISEEDLKKIKSLKSPQRGIWQDFTQPVSKICSDLDIVAIAELYGKGEKPYGQILIGKSIERNTFDRKDLIEFEMVINMAALIIDSKKRTKA